MLCQYGCNQEAKFQLKNGKWCCSKSNNSCPTRRENNSKNRSGISRAWSQNNGIKIKCKFCNKEFFQGGLGVHKKNCYLNPKNLKSCPICGTIIKDYKHNSTCSYKCANRFFKDKYIESHKYGKAHTKGNISPKENYRKICFTHHKKECIICKEVNIVEVHHYDKNKENNNPTNLIPLCPNHHKYIHINRLKKLVSKNITNYYKTFLCENPVLEETTTKG